jgi:hypothetical protein
LTLAMFAAFSSAKTQATIAYLPWLLWTFLFFSAAQGAKVSAIHRYICIDLH